MCNGRVILEADRSKETGWGLVEEENDEILIPKFHNQFARFRGIVTFDSADAARVPWNTMKDDVDRESAVWQQTFVRMIEMMRPVVDFLNQLDANITEYTREGSVLLKYVANAGRINNEQIRQKHTFVAPKAQDIQAARTSLGEHPILAAVAGYRFPATHIEGRGLRKPLANEPSISLSANRGGE